MRHPGLAVQLRHGGGQEDCGPGGGPPVHVHAEAKKLGGELVAFLHYPPVYDNMECQELLDLLAENQVSRCYFGHIHGQYAAQKALVGEYKGVHMRLISADYVQFCPVRVE